MFLFSRLLLLCFFLLHLLYSIFVLIIGSIPTMIFFSALFSNLLSVERFCNASLLKSISLRSFSAYFLRTFRTGISTIDFKLVRSLLLQSDESKKKKTMIHRHRTRTSLPIKSIDIILFMFFFYILLLTIHNFKPKTKIITLVLKSNIIRRNVIYNPWICSVFITISKKKKKT